MEIAELLHRVAKGSMRRPNKFDWMIYKLFRWYWNPLLAQNGGLLARAMVVELQKWLARNGK